MEPETWNALLLEDFVKKRTQMIEHGVRYFMSAVEAYPVHDDPGVRQKLA